jgi:hypothetical protein
MKVATTTIVLATFCCTAAFGLNGATKSGIAKQIGFAPAGRKPMVQPIDVQGQRISMVRATLKSSCRATIKSFG